MHLRDVFFAHPGVQPFAYRAGASLGRLAGVFHQRSGAVLGTQAPILLIVGCGRSGNTLLRRSLMERGSIYIPPESYVFASQANSFLRASALSWPDQVALALGKLEYMREFDTFQVASLRSFALTAAEWHKQRRSLGGLLVELYFWLANEVGVPADWVGDKTPMNLVRIGLIARIFPNARYIYIERDPVDVAISYQEAGLYRTLAEGARRWKLSRQAWLRFRQSLGTELRVEVRFDELVTSRDAICDQVLSTFDIPRRRSTIDVTHALGDVNMHDHHRSARENVRPERVGDARSRLRREDLASLRRVLGDMPERAGYESI